METQPVVDPEENLRTLLTRAESARGGILAWFDATLRLWRCAWCDRPMISQRCDCGEN